MRSHGPLLAYTGGGLVTSAVNPGSERGTTRGMQRGAQQGVLYLLYMHLCPPRLKVKKVGDKDQVSIDREDRYLVDVPWFKGLWERRYGAFVRVVSTAGKGHFHLGELLWAKEEVALDGQGRPAKAAYEVWGRGEPIPLKGADGAVEWLYKPAPAALVEAAQGLADGKVVTFSEPFLMVSAGEPLGFVTPLPEGTVERTPAVCWEVPILDKEGKPVLDCDDEPRVRRLTSYARSGALHFQVFGPQKDPDRDHLNGVKLLMELAGKLTPKVEFQKASDESEDNFVSLADFSAFKDKLTEPDQKAFEEAFKGLEDTKRDGKIVPNFSYCSPMVAMFDSGATFAPAAEKRRSASCGGLLHGL